MTIAHRLIETDVKLINDYLMNNMAAALAVVSADRGDNIVALDVPKEYFTYEPVSGFRPPAVFIIGEEIDFRLGQQQANFIDAICKINVTVLVEVDKNPNLTTAAYRYQCALHQLLAQKELNSSDGRVSIRIKVERAKFSSTYTNAQAPNDPRGRFRKEVVLYCDVEHYERLS